MKKNIDFKIRSDGDIKSVEIYRQYNKDDGSSVWSYIDSIHPMSNMELYWLKNYLQQYLQQTDWE